MVANFKEKKTCVNLDEKIESERLGCRGEDVLFQNTGTKIQIMFKFGCELLLLFSSLHICKCRPYFGSAHAFSLFSLNWLS